MNTDRDEQWRYRYVYQGPESAKQKKVFYVFGNKLKDVDRGIMNEKPLPHRATHFWSVTKRLPNHVYYSIRVKPQSKNELHMTFSFFCKNK